MMALSGGSCRELVKTVSFLSEVALFPPVDALSLQSVCLHGSLGTAVAAARLGDRGSSSSSSSRAVCSRDMGPSGLLVGLGMVLGCLALPEVAQKCVKIYAHVYFCTFIVLPISLPCLYLKVEIGQGKRLYTGFQVPPADHLIHCTSHCT